MMRTLDKGDNSDVVCGRQIVARDAEAWSELWQFHAHARPTPDVDFVTETVVAIFLGTRSTTGYAVELVAHRDADFGMIVDFRVSQPAPGAAVAQVVTTPFHIVAIP